MKPTTPPDAPPPLEPTLTFWGAAGGVSGSMHLVEAGNHKILLDCGMHQGKREDARQRVPTGKTELAPGGRRRALVIFVASRLIGLQPRGEGFPLRKSNADFARDFPLRSGG